MPKELDEFCEAIRYFDVDEAITEDNKVQGYIDYAKNFGQDILDNFRDFCTGRRHAEPLKPNGLVRTMSETAFLEPKNASALDEVTKPTLVEYTSKSNIFKNISYRVRDLSVLATYKDKNRNQDFGLRLGDKLGLQYTKHQGSTSYTAKIEQNIYNNKCKAEYSVSNPVSSCSASVYHKNGNFGTTFSYANDKGFGASVSFEGHNKAISAGYTHKFSDCRLSVRGFVGTYEQHLDDFQNKNTLCTFGLCGNITM